MAFCQRRRRVVNVDLSLHERSFFLAGGHVCMMVAHLCNPVGCFVFLWVFKVVRDVGSYSIYNLHDTSKCTTESLISAHVTLLKVKRVKSNLLTWYNTLRYCVFYPVSG